MLDNQDRRDSLLRTPPPSFIPGLRETLQSIFSRPALLWWYSATLGCNFDSESAASDFLQRSSTSDVTPVRYFDPVRFRARYRVRGPNAFIAYLSDESRRLAWPSPLFSPRWYCRR